MIGAHYPITHFLTIARAPSPRGSHHHFVMLGQAVLFRGAGRAVIWAPSLALAAIGAGLSSGPCPAGTWTFGSRLRSATSVAARPGQLVG